MPEHYPKTIAQAGTSDGEIYPLQTHDVLLGEAGSITITYDEDGVRHTYKGTEEGEGHYRLERTDHQGRARLHRFSGDDEIVGWWEEEGVIGWWHLLLRE